MRETGLNHAERVAMARLKALLELLPVSLDKQMARVGLNSFEFTLLEALTAAPDRRLRLSALASRTNATLPRLSRVVTGLEGKGLVIRTACSEDGRATNAVLTGSGVARYAAAKPIYEAAIRSSVFADLNQTDVDDLSRLAYLILARLEPHHRLATTAGGVPVASGDAVACPADVALTPAGSTGSAASDAAVGSSTCPANPTS